MTFFISLFLLLMQFLWKYIDDLVGKGLEGIVILELMMYAAVNLIPMALPLAILLSSIMTFGNLGENYELVALKSSGISLQRIMLPLIIVSMLISVGAFYFSNNIMPITNLKFRSILHDVRKQRPELSIKEGQFYNGIDGYSIRVGKKNKKTNMMYDLMIYDHTKKEGNTNVTVADSGNMHLIDSSRYMILKLYDGKKYERLEEPAKNRRQKTYPFQRDYFKEEIILFELSGFGFERSDESLWKDNYEMLNVKQLQFTIDSLKLALVDKKMSFTKNVFISHYFRREIKVDSLKTDSLLKLKNIYVNTDSLYNSLEVSKKQRIVEMALNYARATKSYIYTSTDDIQYRKEWISKFFIEWHRKFTLSISCIILFFIGAPLGAIIRKGGLGMPAVVSVLFFILYYIISITGEKFSKEGVLLPAEGMWMSTAILLPLGIFLTYKATTDSVIFDITTYLEPVKKILNKVFKSKI